ncbi:NAD(P)H-hydrate dehydratase [Sulfuracidifex metallicus]|uniref:NAD(P)H-hydrate dehydratase n=1 Tax=Sulfuracidifex metallicus TaxID=47303 RepID=UPI002275A98B|nr:NAD(P)H-hydrate dehydratase [Sulfuracidifex metallicus]MCY0849505.1 NAD(P)H-hydrate dehydratase [Sulfuracidifex metallicus]
MISSKEMRTLEINSEALGIPTLLLMENAGSSVVDEIKKRINLSRKKAVIFAGHGGKGGDGLVVARHLAEEGVEVEIILLGENKHKDALVNLNAIIDMDYSVKIRNLNGDQIKPVEADILVDAMLGTGLKGEPREPFKSAIQAFNDSKGFKISIDLPSGYDADEGCVNEVFVKADLVVTFHDIKKGLANLNNIVVRKIGIPLEASIYVGPGDVLLNMPKRDPRSKKGDNGRVAVIGGSHQFSGAPYFSSIAALKTGVDLVYAVVPESISRVISERSPDLIVIETKGNDFSKSNLDDIKEIIKRVDSVVVGPGMGTSQETREFSKEIVRLLMDMNKPTVLDADALKASAGMRLNKNFVITPHAGEFEIFSGVKPSPSIRERIKQVIEISNKFNVNILLKGFVDVASEGTTFKLNKTGNPAMTVGGTGDVLTGIIAGLMARKVNPFISSYMGAFINGIAGSIVYERLGEHLKASEIIEAIPDAMNDPLSNFQKRIYRRILE